MSRGLECALWGNCTRDAEVRTSKSGNEFAIVNLMTQDGSTDGDGKPNAVFVKTLCFGEHVKTARGIKRGDRVYAEGQLQPGIWRTNDGEPRLDLTLKAFTLQKTGIGKNRPPREHQQPDYQAPIEQDRPPFSDEIGF